MSERTGLWLVRAASLAVIAIWLGVLLFGGRWISHRLAEAIGQEERQP